MDSYVEVFTRTARIKHAIPALDALGLVLSRYGFFDLDVDPGVDIVRITASNEKSKVTASGANVASACEKLLDTIISQRIA